MRGMLRALALFGMLPAFGLPAPGLIQVTGARAWSNPGVTRVVIELTGPFEFRADRATNPDRLFFDIAGAVPSFDGKRLAVRNIGDALVERLRIAETAPGTTRIVFDLESAAEFTVDKLSGPDRLVVEIRGPGVPKNSGVPKAKLSTFIAPPVIAPQRVRTTESYVPPTAVWNAGAVVPLRLPDPFRTLTVMPFAQPPVPVYSSAEVVPVTPKAGLPQGKMASVSATRAEKPSLSLTRALGLKINRVVIDAGHGGHDVGTLGPNGIREKDVVLDVARRVATLIQERLGAEVVMTRSDDTFIPLQERTQIANRNKADLFLSIHANSSPAKEVAGTESFYLNFTSSPGALEVAARENAGADKTVGELRDLIKSITLNDKIEESRVFAQEIEKSIAVNASRNNPVARDRGIKRAPFVVLIGASMPSVLAEIGFLSNTKDERNLSKPEYRQKVAEALYKGVAQYSQSLSHFEVSQKTASATGKPGAR